MWCFMCAATLLPLFSGVPWKPSATRESLNAQVLELGRGRLRACHSTCTCSYLLGQISQQAQIPRVQAEKYCCSSACICSHESSVRPMLSELDITLNP